MISAELDGKCLAGNIGFSDNILSIRNNTSLDASIDNTINNSPSFPSLPKIMRLSNNKKSSEESISISQPKSKDQLNLLCLLIDYYL